MNTKTLLDAIEDTSAMLYPDSNEIMTLCKKVVAWEINNIGLQRPRYSESFQKLFYEMAEKIALINGEEK